MNDPEVQLNINIPVRPGQAAYVSESVENSFQPKRLVIEGDTKQWYIFRLSINHSNHRELNLPGERFSVDAPGVVDMPPVQKGDSIGIVVGYVGTAPESPGPFRCKLIGTNILQPAA